MNSLRTQLLLNTLCPPLNPTSSFPPTHMSPTQLHPDIKPRNHIKCKNVCSAACLQISYILYNTRKIDHIWTCRCLSWTFPLNLFKLNGTIAKHHQNLHRKLWSPAGLCTNMCCGRIGQKGELILRVTLSDKQANESCESCHFPLHFSHESVPCGGRQNADSTGNVSLSQITTISSDGEESDLCVTVKFLIDCQAHFHWRQPCEWHIWSA